MYDEFCVLMNDKCPRTRRSRLSPFCWEEPIVHGFLYENYMLKVQKLKGRLLGNSYTYITSLCSDQ